MTRFRLGTLLTAVVVLSGCYHATIETGLPPGNQTLEKPWASSWIGGLVPPQTVETASRCPNGVARIETQQSFVNGLVAWITFFIYTPMTIVVTCAGPDTPMDEADQDAVSIRLDANIQEKQHAFHDAAMLAARRGVPVLLKFE
jgi:hypothetical protein